MQRMFCKMRNTIKMEIISNYLKDANLCSVTGHNNGSINQATSLIDRLTDRRTNWYDSLTDGRKDGWMG